MTAILLPSRQETEARLLAGDRPVLRLDQHRKLHGELPAVRRHDARELQEALRGAGLRGRGGAGFPTARKLEAAYGSGRRGLLIVNATESEPASLKDATLVSHAPHLVLDGAQLAARSIRAREVVVALHEGSAVHRQVVDALQQRSGDDVVPTRVLLVPHSYVAGEASSLARAAGGGPALPLLHDQPLAVRGLDGRPQVVLNAETLAGLALFLLHGSAWYRELGTADEPGTVLLTVRRSSMPPAVVEVAVGTPVASAFRIAGMPLDGVQALLGGGYAGAWLPYPDVRDVPVSRAGFAAVGGTLGAGVLCALGDDECGLRATAQVVTFLARESARQCGPCLNGLSAIARSLEQLAHGRPPEGTVEQLTRWCGLVEGRGLCAHPDGAATLVRSGLSMFAQDVARHASGDCGRGPGTSFALPPRGR